MSPAGLGFGGRVNLRLLLQLRILQARVVDFRPGLLIHRAHRHRFPFAIAFDRALENTGIEPRFDHRIGLGLRDLLRVHEIVHPDPERVDLSPNE